MLYSRPTKVASPKLPENIAKFEKAKDIHSKMAIYFDENFYSNERDDENCYKYMYLIYYMLACKNKYFASYSDYDGYAQYAANVVYMRFIKKQEKGERIKSVLNYIKSTLYPLKVMYQNATFRTILTREKNGDIIDSVQESMRQYVQNQYNGGMEEDIVEVFTNIPYYIKETISHTPYKYDKLMCKKLTMSCLITLLKSFTLSNENQEKLQAREEKGLNVDETLYKMFNKERETSTTVWRLDQSMGNYIQVLSNQIRKKILKDIEEVRHSYTLSEDTIDAILMTAWDGTNHNDNDQEMED